ncbi:hypothetical protein [Flaviflexus massiliensis]|uniref:hypothetical protein n=1 Tax=Flaviflexus massiliensis TaxID=1522309 RepID=UPI0006D52E89|nr:hypothetical protein [Flaviflexus massiliensis]
MKDISNWTATFLEPVVMVAIIGGLVALVGHFLKGFSERQTVITTNKQEREELKLDALVRTVESAVSVQKAWETRAGKLEERVAHLEKEQARQTVLQAASEAYIASLIDHINDQLPPPPPPRPTMD